MARKKSRVFCSVDLGLQGALAVIDLKGKLIDLIDLPTQPVVVNKKKRKEYKLKELITYFSNLTKKYDVVLTGFERLRGMPGQASQTGFSLGFSSGVFKILCNVFEMEWMEFEARSWQKLMFSQLDYIDPDTKVNSSRLARKLYPDVDFRLSPRCKKDADGRTDALLMALYTKQIYEKKQETN